MSFMGSKGKGKKNLWVNVNRRVNGQIPFHHVYCGNGWVSQGLYQGKWANPFDNVWDGVYSREEALELYKYMFEHTKALKESVHELDGLILADHAPNPRVSHCTFLSQQARLAAQKKADEKYAQEEEEEEEEEEKEEGEVGEEEEEEEEFLLTPKPSSKLALKRQQAFLKAPKKVAATQSRVLPLKKRVLDEMQQDGVPKKRRQQVSPKKKWSPTVSPLATLLTPSPEKKKKMNNTAEDLTTPTGRPKTLELHGALTQSTPDVTTMKENYKSPFGFEDSLQ